MTMILKDFANIWQDCWNSHDLDSILAHYREDVVFRSKKAIALVGIGEVSGKDQLREYWSEAIKRQPDLHFMVKNVFEGHNMLVIVYTNHRDVLSAETLYFDRDGLIYQAAACHCP